MQTDDMALLAGMRRFTGIRAEQLARLALCADACFARRELLAKELYWYLLKSPREAELLQRHHAAGLEAVADRLLREWRRLLFEPLDAAAARRLQRQGERYCRLGIGVDWLSGLYERGLANLAGSLAEAGLPVESEHEFSRLLRKRVLLEQMLTLDGYQGNLRSEAAARQNRLHSMSGLYAALSGLSLALADGADRRALLQAVCEICAREAGCAAAWAALPDDDGLRLAALAHSHDAVGGPMDALIRGGGEQGGNPAARAMRSRSTQVINDLRSEPALRPWNEALGIAGDGSLLVAPLQVRQQVVGVLALHAAEAGFFDQTRLALFDAMVRETGRALERQEALERSHRAETELAFLAQHDALTGLPNRGQMQQLIDRLLAARFGGGQVAVLAIAVEGFHEVNARLGYDGGDLVLCETARRLREAIYPFGYVGRVGASRFIACSERMDQLAGLVERLLRQLPLPAEAMGTTVELRCSVGVAVSSSGPGDAASLLRRADLALSRAKEQGGGHYRHYDAAMDEEIRKLHALRGAFALAIPRGELALYYQPKINLQTRRVEGAEALVRWVRDGRNIAPGEFFPAIEHSGLIRELDWWVLREAVRQTGEWRRRGQAIPVSVNLSAATLKHEDFLLTLEALLEAHPLPAGFLELEVLESVTQQEAEQITPRLERCRDLGLSIALDDFGTGASSLVHLQQLPFDTIKIDQRFVRLLLEMPGNEAIIRSMLAFAHYTGRKLVVEGVESRAIWQRLLEIGCHDGQGYGISPPLAAHELPEWVHEWSRAGEDADIINSSYAP
ncbi:EAL domain-containing protein [Chromobacterium sp. CV08]|uniref:EAL domain-containing protein n=1 Tax=Chromobacterium sp. CV08 TaxID=3133274 RepID=UPI003DAA3EA0